MRLIFGLILAVGLALAGGAVFLAKSYIGTYQQALQKERSKANDQVPLVKVYVANRDMAFGEPLLPEDVTLISWPRANIPKGAFGIKRPVLQEGQEPRVTLRAFVKYEAFLDSNVSAPGADAGLTSRLAKGERAFTIEVDVSSGVSGFLRPGDRVDVYWTGKPPSNAQNDRRGDVTKLIQSRVRLIAVDQTSNEQVKSASIARTVTVAATAQQIAGLTQAQSTGRLTLSLLGIDDDTVSGAIEVDQRSLLGLSEPTETILAEVPEVCTIRTRKGSEVVEIPIPCTN